MGPVETMEFRGGCVKIHALNWFQWRLVYNRSVLAMNLTEYPESN